MSQDVPLSFETFSSVENLSAELRAARERAALLTPPGIREQVTYGSYVIRPVPELGCLVFGAIPESRETIQDPDAEAFYSMDMRFGIWHSILTPLGEPGWAHVGSLWPISQVCFEAAKEAEWACYINTHEWVASEMAKMRTHHLRWLREIGVV